MEQPQEVEDEAYEGVWDRVAARFRDLGSGYYDERVSAERKIRSHVRQLEALGLTVTITPAQDAA